MSFLKDFLMYSSEKREAERMKLPTVQPTTEEGASLAPVASPPAEGIQITSVMSLAEAFIVKRRPRTVNTDPKGTSKPKSLVLEIDSTKISEKRIPSLEVLTPEEQSPDGIKISNVQSLMEVVIPEDTLESSVTFESTKSIASNVMLQPETIPEVKLPTVNLNLEKSQTVPTLDITLLMPKLKAMLQDPAKSDKIKTEPLTQEIPPDNLISNDVVQPVPTLVEGTQISIEAKTNPKPPISVTSDSKTLKPIDTPTPRDTVKDSPVALNTLAMNQIKTLTQYLQETPSKSLDKEITQPLLTMQFKELTKINRKRGKRKMVWLELTPLEQKTSEQPLKQSDETVKPLMVKPKVTVRPREKLPTRGGGMKVWKGKGQKKPSKVTPSQASDTQWTALASLRDPELTPLAQKTPEQPLKQSDETVKPLMVKPKVTVRPRETLPTRGGGMKVWKGKGRKKPSKVTPSQASDTQISTRPLHARGGSSVASQKWLELARLESVAELCLKHELLLNHAAQTEKPLEYAKALKEMALNLDMDYESVASVFKRFRIDLFDVVRARVRACIAERQPAQRALRGAPPALATLARRLHLVTPAVQAEFYPSNKPALEWAARELVSALVRGVRRYCATQLQHGASADPGDVPEAVLCEAMAELGAYAPNVPPHKLKEIWCQLCLIKRAQFKRWLRLATPGDAFDDLDWLILDTFALYSHDSYMPLVTEDMLEGATTLRSLAVLVQLLGAVRADLQRADLSAKARCPQRAELWVRVVAAYHRTRRGASLVVLQRTWRQLCASARDALLCAPLPAPLLLLVAKLFPYVIVRKDPESWSELVRTNRVVTDDDIPESFKDVNPIKVFLADLETCDDDVLNSKYLNDLLRGKRGLTIFFANPLHRIHVADQMRMLNRCNEPYHDGNKDVNQTAEVNDDDVSHEDDEMDFEKQIDKHIWSENLVKAKVKQPDTVKGFNSVLARNTKEFIKTRLNMLMEESELKREKEWKRMGIRVDSDVPRSNKQLFHSEPTVRLLRIDETLAFRRNLKRGRVNVTQAGLCCDLCLTGGVGRQDLTATKPKETSKKKEDEIVILDSSDSEDDKTIAKLKTEKDQRATIKQKCLCKSVLRPELTGLTETFLSHNKNLLALCKPVVVRLKETDRPKSGRVVKKVELADIDEVRRINRTILTAQVLPITNVISGPNSTSEQAGKQDRLGAAVEKAIKEAKTKFLEHVSGCSLVQQRDSTYNLQAKYTPSDMPGLVPTAGRKVITEEDEVKMFVREMRSLVDAETLEAAQRNKREPSQAADAALRLAHEDCLAEAECAVRLRLRRLFVKSQKEIGELIKAAITSDTPDVPTRHTEPTDTPPKKRTIDEHVEPTTLKKFRKAKAPAVPEPKTEPKTEDLENVLSKTIIQTLTADGGGTVMVVEQRDVTVPVISDVCSLSTAQRSTPIDGGSGNIHRMVRRQPELPVPVKGRRRQQTAVPPPAPPAPPHNDVTIKRVQNPSQHTPNAGTIANVGPGANVLDMPDRGTTDNVDVPNVLNLPNVGTIPNMANTGAVPNMTNIGAVPNMANIGAVPNMANIGAVPNMANIGAIPNMANIGAVLNMANTGTVPNMTNIGAVPNMANTGAVSNMANIGAMANINQPNTGTLANLQNMVNNVGSNTNIGNVPNTGNMALLNLAGDAKLANDMANTANMIVANTATNVPANGGNMVANYQPILVPCLNVNGGVGFVYAGAAPTQPVCLLPNSPNPSNLPATLTLPPNITLPPNQTLPPNLTLPPNVTLTPNLTLPPNVTLTPNLTLPPALPPIGGDATMPIISSTQSVGIVDLEDDTDKWEEPGRVEPPSSLWIARPLPPRQLRHCASILRLDSARPLWTVAGRYLLLTEKYFECEDPTYWTTDRPNQPIIFPDEDDSDDEKTDSKETKDPLKQDRVEKSIPTDVSSEIDSTRVLKVKSFASVQNLEPAEKRGGERRGRKRAKMLMYNNSYFRKVSDKPLRYTQTLSVIHSTEQCDDLLRERAPLYVLDRGRGTVTPLPAGLAPRDELPPGIAHGILVRHPSDDFLRDMAAKFMMMHAETPRRRPGQVYVFAPPSTDNPLPQPETKPTISEDIIEV